MCDYCFSFLEEKFPEFAEKCKEVEVNVVNKHPKAAILLGGSLLKNLLERYVIWPMLVI